MGTKRPAADHADIVHSGGKLILPAEPEKMDYGKAIELLENRQMYESKKIVVRETFDIYPLDGACALDTVLKNRYGWAPATSTHDPFFGEHPPELVSVEVAPGEVRQVPWGKFLLPNITGSITTTTTIKGSRRVFAVEAEILRRDEGAIRALFDDLRAETQRSSIYRGKAIRLRFRDDDGDPIRLPEPKFIRVDDIDPSMLVYSDAVYEEIATNLFVPISRAEDCIANGITLKRSVVLAGTFGVGKTLAAAVAAKLAVQAGITYLYSPRADELPDAIEFAMQYQSPACVIFCEDIDLVTSGERTVSMKHIMDVIDDIDAKTANIIVVLTTNELKKIHDQMRRPGRMDAIIEVTPPDRKAAERLIRIYGKGSIPESTDLQQVAAELEGQIPAVIAEVVARAKLRQLAMQERGTLVQALSAPALLNAAKAIRVEMALARKPEPLPQDQTSTLDLAVAGAVKRALNGEGELLRDISRSVKRVENALA
jgi:transitional endoplasmic reticulum ATPase